MTAKNDLDDLLVSFLEDGATELPDRAFDTVRTGIDRTRQRVAIGPWREPVMSSSTRILGVAAAALVVVVVGSIGFSGLPNPTSAPGPSASAAATPAGAETLQYGWPRQLQPGTYTTSFAWSMPLAVTFTVPAGWHGRDIEIIKGEMAVSVQLVEDLYPDACTGEPAPGSGAGTAQELAEAIAGMDSLSASAIDSTTIGGVAAAHLQYSPQARIPCVGETSHLWSLPAGRIMPFEQLGPPWWLLRHGSHDVWVVEVNGARVLIDATAGPNPSDAAVAEVEAIVASMRFGPPVERHRLGRCTFELTAPATGEGALVEPFVVAMGDEDLEVLGAAPTSPAERLRAHVNFRVSPNGELPGTGRATVGLVPPPGAPTDGFATLESETYVNPDGLGTVGTLLLDAPGTWWAQITTPASECYWQFPVEAIARGG